jgi:hypothetical protein
MATQLNGITSVDVSHEPRVDPGRETRVILAGE